MTYYSIVWELFRLNRQKFNIGIKKNVFHNFYDNWIDTSHMTTEKNLKFKLKSPTQKNNSRDISSSLCYNNSKSNWLKIDYNLTFDVADDVTATTITKINS